MSLFPKFQGQLENCKAIERSAVIEIPTSWIKTLEEIVYEEKQAEKYNISQNIVMKTVKSDYLLFINLIRRQGMSKKTWNLNHYY